MKKIIFLLWFDTSWGGSITNNNGLEERCKKGHYFTNGQCEPCPSGFYCGGDDEKPRQCGIELKELPSLIKQRNAMGYDPCDDGQHKRQVSRRRRALDPTDPKACPPGQFMQCTGQWSCRGCQPCPANTYSVDGYACIPCPTGTAAIRGSSQCTMCQSNEKANTNGQCEPCGTGFNPNLEQTECVKCPAGYFCPAPGVAHLCPVGHYRQETSAIGSCTECTAGNYCASGVTQTSCESGFYSQAGAENCKPCPAGFQCDSKSVIAECSAGQFSRDGEEQCSSCPKGHYCPDKELGAPIPCADGYYQSGEGNATCEICPKDQQCVDKTKAPTNCAANHYSHEGQMLCTPCPDGFDCANNVACAVGEYVNAVSGNCDPCPTDYYCPDPSLKLVCPMGQTPSYPAGTTGASECTTCPKGFYCSGNSKQPCGNGNYCPAGSHRPLPCPPGSFSDTTQLDECKACPIGKCCPTLGVTTALDCPKGHYCPSGTVRCHQFACPAGTFSNTNNAESEGDCTVCAIGKWCPQGSFEERNCPEGFFCERGEKDGYSKSCPTGEYIEGDGWKDGDESQCITCPSGYYCPKGSKNYPSTKKHPCPAGTYAASTDTKWDDQSQCKICPAGYFCPTPAFIRDMWAEEDKCRQGHYCPLGSSKATEHACPAGTQNNDRGKDSIDSCSKCPAGVFCQEGTGAFNNDGVIPLNCNLGHFCPEGSVSGDLNPCPAGTYGPTTDLKDVNACTTCPIGSYCTGGKSAPDGLCPPGHFCELGTKHAKQNACPVSKYQPYFGSTKEAECRDCPLGQFCEAGATWPILCPFGTYSKDGPISSKEECKPCPAGSHCGTGTIEPEKCQPGTFSYPQSWECMPCPSGYYCPNEGTAFDKMIPCDGGKDCEVGTIDQEDSDECPRGYVCPSDEPLPLSCPPGTYQPDKGKSNFNECLPCKEGYYCQEASWYYNVNFLCHPGFYCPNGLDNPYRYKGAIKGPAKIGSYGPRQIPCPAGTYNPEAGKFDEGHCLDCDEGYYCPLGSYEMVTCPLGYYCPINSPDPTPCPKGTFGEKLNLISDAECTQCTKGQYCNAVGLLQPRGPCDPGYVCDAGQETSRPDNQCPAGGYCPAGTYEPWSCPTGTFADQPGQIDKSDCSACTAGSYCSEERKPEVTGPCEAGCYCPGVTPGEFRGSYDKCQEPCKPGHKCEEGAAEPVMCPAGFYQPQDHQATCLECPPGFYCSTEGLTSPTLCDAGRYCPPNTSDEFGRSCQNGTYSAQAGIYDIDQCIQCPRGNYCPNLASDNIGSACSAGYVCFEGSDISVPTDGIYGIQCPQGHFCPSGTTQEYKCPIGTFNAGSGSGTIDECDTCLPTFYCDEPGMASVYETKVCDPGYACTSGANRPDPRNSADGGEPCQVGSYCDRGVASRCRDGYYAEVEGASECLICPDGVDCQKELIDTCPLGYYCQGPPSDTDSAFVREQCGRGTDSQLNMVTGLHDYDECTPCSAGQACVQTDPATSIDTGYFSRSAATTVRPQIESLCNPFEETIEEVENPYENARCGICPEGFFCDGASLTTPTPCGVGTYGDSIGGTSKDNTCLACPAYKYCPYLAMRINDASDCDDGYDCTVGGAVNSRPLGQQCQAGSKCIAGVPSECSSGTFINVKGAVECNDTPLGYYQDLEGQIEAKSCPPGKYCSRTAITLDEDNLDKCPVGTYFGGTELNSQDLCLSCDPGYFCDEEGLTALDDSKKCKEQYKCPGGNTAADEDPCEDGTICTEGADRELICPAGKYCEQGKQIGDCSAGYACPAKSTTDVELDCPPGSYCPSGTGYKLGTECVIGTYQPFERKSDTTDCLVCPVGYYCDEAGNPSTLDDIMEQNKCQDGYYCPQSSISQYGESIDDDSAKLCNAGHYCKDGIEQECDTTTYQDETGRDTCEKCPAGSLCNEKGLTEPALCPLGSYCKDSLETKCPPGRYGDKQNLSESGECPLCPAGYKCPNQGMDETQWEKCDAGYYCHEGTESLGFTCDKGHYCLEGVAYQTACPSGTYNPNEQSETADDCLQCDSGFACPGLGNAEQLRCEAGYYCPAESISTREHICPAGYWCGDGQASGTENPCPETTWSNQEGLKSADECEVCPDGYLCPAETGKPLDSFEKLSKCNPPGSPDHGFCRSGVRQLCRVGFYCSNEASFISEPCKDGTYQDEEGKNSCKPCDTEHLCRASSSGTPSQSVDCPEGWNCKQNGVYDEEPCKPGEYQDILVSRTCEACPEGESCPSIANYNIEPCERGFYCSQGERYGAPNTCAVGESCPTGTKESDARECEAGEYAPVTGMDKCVECPAGHSCPTTGMDSFGECLENNYCQRGQSPTECDAGSFNTNKNGRSSRACQQCLPGHFCLQGQNPAPCEAGYYCPLGSDAKNKVTCQYGICEAEAYVESICPPGYTCDGANPQPCPDGSYCLTESDIDIDEDDSDTINECDAGFYCNSSSVYPISCPLGTYKGNKGGNSDTECTACNQDGDNGYYCNEIGQTQLKNLCKDGYDCSTGRNVQPDYTACSQGQSCRRGLPTDCAETTYQSAQGEKDCINCPVGFICDSPKTIYPDQCPAGQFCRENLPVGTCAAGTYRDLTGAVDDSDCFACQPGKYCPANGMNIKPIESCDAGYYCTSGAGSKEPNSERARICPAGHYCPSEVVAPVPCPVGSYRTLTGGKELGDCDRCTPSRICDEEGRTQDGEFCEAGFVCDADGNKTPCPIGYYCADDRTSGDETEKCPGGYWSDREGLERLQDCYSCPEGFYCPDASSPHISFTDLEVCDAKYYCPAGSAEQQKCPSGFKCPNAGLSTPIECELNKFTDSELQEKCEFCQPGESCSYASPQLIGNALLRASRRSQCPLGYYCTGDDSGKTNGTLPCPVGTYGASLSLSDIQDCTPCDTGYFCDVPAMVPTQLNADHRCGAGSDCQSGAITKVPSANVHSCLPPSSKPTYYDAGPCEEGYSCRDGQAVLCEVATFSNSSAHACVDCPAGYDCQPGTEMVECQTGSFCASGREPEDCPAGTIGVYERARSSDDCIDCKAGYYCPGTGEINHDNAEQCEAGYYCDGGDSTSAPSAKKCTVGEFCPAGSEHTSPCPPGKQCPSGRDDDLTNCEAGSECKIDNDRHKRDACPVGHSCNGDKYPVACPRGQFQAQTRQTGCEPCTDAVCDGVGTFTTSRSTACYDGFYCHDIDGTNSPVDRQDFAECERGWQCQNNKRDECDDGTYQDSVGQSSCNVCYSGYQCDKDKHSSTSSPCEKGNYCVGTDTVARDQLEIEECPKGTYLHLTGGASSDDCVPCKAGYACDSKGLPEPLNECDAGYFCTIGASRTRPSSVSSSDEISGPCPEGTYCPVTDNSTPTKCPLGTIRSRTRGIDENDCSDCPEGYYCDEAGLDKTTEEKSCVEGFFCSVRQSHSYENECQPGSYCPPKSKTGDLCPTGTFSSSSFLVNESDCSQCPMGFACPERGQSDYTELCDEGYYCPGGAKRNTSDACEKNFICSEGSSFPQQCPVDQFSSGKRKTTCEPCQNGKLCSPLYQTESDSNLAYIDCPAGYFCNYNDKTLPVGTNPERCPLGTFNEKTGRSESDDCLFCDPGTYCDGTQPWQRVDNKCAGGFICQEAAFTPYPFNITKYPDCSGLDGLPSQSADCQPGSGCEEGSASEDAVKCPIGYYTSVPNAKECLLCPAGYDCNEEGISDYVKDDYACPAGHYCENGVKEQCDVGTYNPRLYGSSIKDCLPCPNGYWCNERAKTEITDDDLCPAGSYCEKGSIKQDCPQGHYCPIGSVQPTTCPAGYNCVQTSNTDFVDYPCESGYYCKPGTGSAANEPQECSIGYYCPSETQYEVPCKPGTYNDVEGRIEADDCQPCPYGKYCPGYANDGTNLLDCPAGFYCNQGTSNPNDTPCPFGYKCPEGDLEAPIPCHGQEGDADGGLYQDGKGAKECKVCPAGYYCLDKDNIDNGVIYPYKCPLGHFCPEGTSDYDQSDRKCPTGKYGSVEGLTQEIECTDCWGGYYCDQIGSTDGRGASLDDPTPDNKCAAGFFCPEGSESSREKDCPVGFYCEEGSAGPRPCPRGTSSTMGALAKSLDECVPCPSGNYCVFKEQAGEDFPVLEDKPCSDGYVCVRGAYSPTPAHYIEGKEWQCNNGLPKNSESCFAEVNDLWEESADGWSEITGYPCQLGWACSQQLGVNQEQKCPQGTYQPRRAQSECVQCPRGRHCGGEGLSESKACSEGNYCEAGDPFETPCPAGKYSDQPGIWAAEHCRPCPAGHKCPQNPSTGNGCAEPEKCQEGFYCKAEAASDTLPDGTGNDFCPRGYYCPEGTLIPQPCPPGTYGASKGLSRRINNGRREPNGCEPCRTGYFCPFWAMDSTLTGQLILDERYECDAGFVCEGSTVRDPMESMCNVGYSCDAKQEFPCANVRFQSARGQGTCLTCPAGSECDPGEEDVSTIYTPCPEKHYCAEGAPPSDCPRGSFMDYTGAGIDDIQPDCFSCPPGKFCTEGEVKEDCDAGYICYSGSSTPTPGQIGSPVGEPCPQGYYCVKGATDISICSTSGEFVQFPVEPNKEGASDEASCQACEDGQLCPEGAITVRPCNAGSYCKAGVAIECPAGTYNGEIGQSSDEACLSCEPGWYCPDKGQNTFEQYPAYPGFYVDTIGAANLTEAEMCLNGTAVPSAQAEDLSVAVLCENGYYCPYPGMSSSMGCEEGSFCPPASFVDSDNLFPDVDFSLGNKEALECPAGYYCPETTSILPCTAGYYCPAGSADQRACDDGLYCPESGTCPAWDGEDLSINGDGASPCRCPNGYYELPDSIRSSIEDTCAACPPGTFNNGTSFDACHVCGAGVICNSPAVTDQADSSENNGNTVKCPAGYECGIGALEPTPCPMGTFYSFAWEQCQPCPSASDIDCPTYIEAFGIDMNETQFCDENGTNGTYYDLILSFTGSFGNQLASFTCTPCGEDAEQSLSGQETCNCQSKNRNFRATDQTCPCRSGYEIVPPESRGDCSRVIYQLCNEADQFRSVNGECVTREDMDIYCETKGCPKDAYDSFDETLGICKCVGQPLDENCNFDCRKRNEEVFQFVCPDPLANDTRPYVTINGAPVNIDPAWGLNVDEVLSPSSCKNTIESVSPIFVIGADDSFRGIYNPDPSKLEAILKEPFSRKRRQADNVVLIDLGAEFEVTQPASCLELDTLVMFVVSESAYPEYDRESLFNVNDFDAAAFDRMIAELRPEPKPFFYRFYQAGVFAFKLMSDLGDSERDLYVQVVSSEGTCFNTGPFFPASPSTVIQVGITMPRTLLLTPDWVMIITVAVTLIIGLLLALLIYACSEWFGWSKRMYTDMPARSSNKLLKLGDFHSRNADINMEVKTHLHAKRIVFEDLSDDEEEFEDDLLDYPEQLKVEAFDTETLYEMLGEEVTHTTNAIADHEKRSNQVYYQTQADTDALKMIWKAKMNNTVVNDIPVGEYENELADVNTEIDRRREIGEQCHAKLATTVSQMARRMRKDDDLFQSTIAAIEEATYLAGLADVNDKTLVKARFHAILKILEENATKMDQSPVVYYEMYNETAQTAYKRGELFNTNGILLRPDLIDIDKRTGLRSPKSNSVLIDQNGELVQLDTAKLVISPSSSRVYHAQGSLLFDPGRLRVVVFDEVTTSTSDVWLIPLVESDASYQIPALPDAAHFRLMKRIVDPRTGLHAPIVAASLINDELAPVLGASKSSITGLETAVEPFSPFDDDIAHGFDLVNGQIQATNAKLADSGDFDRAKLLASVRSMIDCLHTIARVKFSAVTSLPSSDEIRAFETIKSTKQQWTSLLERLTMFRLERMLIGLEQLEAYDWLRTSGGVVGQMNYKDSGQLLPILIGWTINGGDKILNVYHDFDENKDVPLSLPGLELGSDTNDKLNRPGKLIGLEWNKKESKIDQLVQVGTIRPPLPNNFVNKFETEFGERLKIILKMLNQAESSKGELLSSYKMILEEIVKRSLTRELDEHCVQAAQDHSKRIDKTMQLESARRLAKLGGLKNCLSKAVINVLTGSDLDNDKAVNVCMNSHKKWQTSINKYHTKFEDEKVRHAEREWEIEGSEDYNQKRIIEQRHESNKERIVLEYYDQLTIRIHTTLISVNKVQMSMIESRVRAQLAKNMVRGSFAPLTGIMDASQLKTSSPTTDQMRLLDKLKELLDMFDNGKQAALVHGDKVDEAKLGQQNVAGPTAYADIKIGDSDREIKKQTILRRMEDDTQSVRDLYTDRIIAELDQMCDMFDAKRTEELAQLKAELLINIQHHPERRNQLVEQFKLQAREIERNNDHDKQQANQAILAKFKSEIKGEMDQIRAKYVQEMTDAELDISDLPRELFRDEALYETGTQELDEYLRQLLAEQQARYLASRAYMADQSKIDEAEWERMFREQVAGFFATDDGESIEQKLTEMENGVENLAIDKDVINVTTSDDLMEMELNDLMLDVAHELKLADLRQLTRGGGETDEDKRDALLAQLDQSTAELSRAQAERRESARKALAARLALRHKLKQSGLDQQAIDNALEEYDATLERQQLDFSEQHQHHELQLPDLDVTDGEIDATVLSKVMEEAEKTAKDQNLTTDDANALMKQAEEAELARQRQAQEERQKRQLLLRQRLDQRKNDMAVKTAELEALKKAEQARLAAEEEKRIDQLAQEKDEFDEALKQGKLEASDVRKILAKRHRQETADLKRKLQVEREVAKAELAQERAQQRLAIADNELDAFDVETNQLMQSTDKQLTEDLDAIRLLNELNDRQLAEIEQAMISFCPDVQARLQFDADQAKAQADEDATRAARSNELNEQFERERQVKMQQLAELEAEKARINAETEKEIQMLKEREQAKQEKKRQLAEQKAIKQAKVRAEQATDEADHAAIMAELERQKTKINADAEQRRLEQDERLKERIKQKRDQAEKTKSDLDVEKSKVERELAQLSQAVIPNTSKSNPLKLVPPELSASYSADPLTLLAELPMMGELRQMSSYLADFDRNRVIGAIDSPFMDISDAEYRTEGTLEFKRDLEPSIELIFNYAQSLANHLCDKMELEQIKVVVATSLPHNTMTNNAFRHSYHYNEALKTVFIRSYLFQHNLGKLTLALAHFVAHLRSQSFDDDGDMGFLIHFFKAIKLIGEVQFKTTKTNSARMKADRDLIQERVTGPNEAIYPRSMVTPKLTLHQSSLDKSTLVPSNSTSSSTQQRPTQHKHLIDMESEAVLQLDHLMKIRAGKKNVPDELNELIEEQRDVVNAIQKQIAK